MRSRISSGIIGLIAVFMLFNESSVVGQDWPMINYNKEFVQQKTKFLKRKRLNR